MTAAPVSEPPIIEASAIAGPEDTAIPLSINARLPSSYNTTPSYMQFVITNIPDQAAFDKGNKSNE